MFPFLCKSWNALPHTPCLLYTSLHLRLERAKILLLSTQMKNYEIAAAVGIDDPNYFSVCFRRKYKKTPKEFRMEAGHGKEI